MIRGLFQSHSHGILQTVPLSGQPSQVKTAHGNSLGIMPCWWWIGKIHSFCKKNVRWSRNYPTIMELRCGSGKNFKWRILLKTQCCIHGKCEKSWTLPMSLILAFSIAESVRMAGINHSFWDNFFPWFGSRAIVIQKVIHIQMCLNDTPMIQHKTVIKAKSL